MLLNVLFITSLISAITLLVLGFYSLFVPTFKFWPPPERVSWQRSIFLFLFRLMFYGLIGLSVGHLSVTLEQINVIQILSGLSFFIVGFGLAFIATYDLGWKNAFGTKENFVTKKLFRYTRNPVYVASWLGMLGWGLILNHWQISIVLALWAVLYYIAIFLEERWLEEKYSKEYSQYKLGTPRFF